MTLIQLNVFEIVQRTYDMKVRSGIWALKRKRYLDGWINKLKARYCTRGFEQEKGVDYFEIFSPVVMWLTVRLLLVLSIILKLKTTQVDYTGAFVHAPIDCLVYVEIPKGFTVDNKSLYGCKQSPRNYFLYHKTKLEAMGFQQADSDPCLFISSDIICLNYVDDNLYSFKIQKAWEELLFHEEESVAGYLGIHIDWHSDGSINLTQKGLIQKILDAMHLNDDAITPVKIPFTDYFPIDLLGEKAHGDFNYAIINGQLNYLQVHLRPDIGLSVSQTSRYVHNPKESHELALIYIGRYLKGAADKGIIFRLSTDGTFKTNIDVDASFADGWRTKLSTNLDSVKSRTGYIIEVAYCPVLWISKM